MASKQHFQYYFFFTENITLRRLTTSDSVVVPGQKLQGAEENSDKQKLTACSCVYVCASSKLSVDKKKKKEMMCSIKLYVNIEHKASSFHRRIHEQTKCQDELSQVISPDCRAPSTDGC